MFVFFFFESVALNLFAEESTSDKKIEYTFLTIDYSLAFGTSG